MSARPWFPFFPADWRSDPGLRRCSLAARGLWIEMLALMHEAEPRGHLLVNGMAPTMLELCHLCGAKRSRSAALLVEELHAKGVLSRTESGVWFSRKMTRDSQKSERNAENGRKGGHPSLKRNRQSGLSHEVKPHKPEAISYKPERAYAPAPEKRKPRGLAFDGAVLTVWDWQHEELSKRLVGNKREDFDLLAWYPAVEAAVVASGEALPMGDRDRRDWLTRRLYVDAKLPTPKLLSTRDADEPRRHIPDAEATRAYLARVRGSVA